MLSYFLEINIDLIWKQASNEASKEAESKQ